jgi:leucyl aminopeptidase
VPAHPDIAVLASRVSADQIRLHVERLSGAADAPTRSGPRRIRSRHVRHPDVVVAQDYLAETLEATGLQVKRLSFGYPAANPVANIEATLPGESAPGEVYLLSAHYDSTASRSSGWEETRDPAPGADDDASGCAVVLEAARLLRQARLRATVRFLFFGAEEEGLLGSEAYASAARARGEDIRLMVSIDPAGNAGPLAGNLFFTYDVASREEASRLAEVGARYRSSYPVLIVPGDSSLVADDRSDHHSFWDQGYRGLHGVSLPGDAYHTTEDTAEKLDYAFAAEATRVVVAHFAEAAGFIAAVSAARGGGGCAASGGSAGWIAVVVVLFCARWREARWLRERAGRIA